MKALPQFGNSQETEILCCNGPLFWNKLITKWKIFPGTNMQTDEKQHRVLLQAIARRAMLQRGLLPDFSSEALAELDRIQSPASINDGQLRDLRGLLWASIDNDDSRDLDQLTVAVAMPADKVKILVAVADVDELVNKGSAIDEHARHIPLLFIPLPRSSLCFPKSFLPA